MKCMEGSKENWRWDLGSVGVNVNFRALEKSIWVLEKPWKSPGNLFLKKGTNPVFRTGVTTKQIHISLLSTSIACANEAVVTDYRNYMADKT